MIANILEKCLAELNRDKVDFSYIKGMLEVLLAMQPQLTGVYSGKTADSKPANVGSTPATPATDEASILDAQARASLETIKKLAEQSQG